MLVIEGGILISCLSKEPYEKPLRIHVMGSQNWWQVVWRSIPEPRKH